MCATNTINYHVQPTLTIIYLVNRNLRGLVRNRRPTSQSRTTTHVIRGLHLKEWHTLYQLGTEPATQHNRQPVWTKVKVTGTVLLQIVVIQSRRTSHASQDTSHPCQKLQWELIHYTMYLGNETNSIIEHGVTGLIKT